MFGSNRLQNLSTHAARFTTVKRCFAVEERKKSSFSIIREKKFCSRFLQLRFPFHLPCVKFTHVNDSTLETKKMKVYRWADEISANYGIGETSRAL